MSCQSSHYSVVPDNTQPLSFCRDHVMPSHSHMTIMVRSHDPTAQSHDYHVMPSHMTSTSGHMTLLHSHMTYISGVMRDGSVVAINRDNSSIPHILASRTLQREKEAKFTFKRHHNIPVSLTRPLCLPYCQWYSLLLLQRRPGRLRPRSRYRHSDHMIHHWTHPL